MSKEPPAYNDCSEGSQQAAAQPAPADIELCMMCMTRGFRLLLQGRT